ncbi:unnamed protein product, partial [Symbiodinium microadriaticum]
IYIRANSDQASMLLDWKAWGTALEKVWGASDWHFGGRGSLGIVITTPKPTHSGAECDFGV